MPRGNRLTREIPDDPDRPGMICTPQMQNLVDDLGWGLVGRILGDRFGVDEPGFAATLECAAPTVEAGSANAEIAARLCHAA